MASVRISSPKMTSASIGGYPIDLEAAIALKNLLLGGPNKLFPDGWLGQAFTFHTEAGLSFGLVQKRGGPCGALAVIQAFILKFFLFDKENGGANRLQPDSNSQEKALVAALSHVLLQVDR